MSAVVEKSKCTGCGECISSCPVDAIAIDGDKLAVIDPSTCADCGACVDVCPAQAISL